jgi:hypothetical protein
MLLPHVIFGTLREHYIMLFGAAGAFSATCGFVAAWAGARIGARKGARLALQDDARLRVQPDHRIDQLVLAVDAIALEVERMAEGQRFTARLLSERAAAPVLPTTRRESGSVTPH